jgi:hypothetical protein
MKKSESAPLSPDTCCRAHEKAIAAAVRPKHREGLGAGTRHEEKRRRLSSLDHRWRLRATNPNDSSRGGEAVERLGAEARQ